MNDWSAPFLMKLCIYTLSHPHFFMWKFSVEQQSEISFWSWTIYPTKLYLQCTMEVLSFFCHWILMFDLNWPCILSIIDINYDGRVCMESLQRSAIWPTWGISNVSHDLPIQRSSNSLRSTSAIQQWSGAILLHRSTTNNLSIRCDLNLQPTNCISDLTSPNLHQRFWHYWVRGNLSDERDLML